MFRIDLADDLRSGRGPVARCHAEDLALMVAARKTREVVEQASHMDGGPNM